MDSYILFMIDTTGSMHNYIVSLKSSILQLEKLIVLLGTDTKIGILAYKDQSDRFTLEWSEWCTCTELNKLNNFVSKIVAVGGSSDLCEASKTAICKALEHSFGKEDKTLVIHYSDAPPHCYSFYFGQFSASCGNNIIEKNRLEASKSPWDWIQICNLVHTRNLTICTLYSQNPNYRQDPNLILAYYSLLGQVINLTDITSENITRTSIDVILSHFNGSSFRSYPSYEMPKDHTFANEIALGSKDAIPTLVCIEYFPTFKVFNNFPNLGALVQRFKESGQPIERTGTDPRRTVAQPYRDLVYNVLENLMCTRDGIMAMTWNPIFGTLWRLVCTFNRIDERSVDLNNKMSMELSKLGPQDLIYVRNWLEESYNKEEEVQKMIKNIPDFSPDSLVFIIDMKEPVTKRELMDVMRGTSDNKATGKVICFLSTVQTIAFKDIPVYKKEKMFYVPVELPSRDVMAIISHLIAPGIIMSQRPAAIISILTCLALEPSSMLYAHAANYLYEECGRWIDVHKDELCDNYCMEFMHMINQLRAKPISPEFLSDKEIRFYDNLNSLINVLKNLNKYLTVQKPYSAKNKSMQHFDHTVTCIQCNRIRSFTLMHSPNQCGPCYLNMPDQRKVLELIPAWNSSYTQTLDALNKLPSQLSDKTNLFSCETCTAYYSVINIDKLNVRPKCHFCRTRARSITTQCSRCTNNFVDEANILHTEFNSLCGQCTYTEQSFEELKITIRDILKKSPGLLELFGIHRKSLPYLSMNKSLYKACTGNPPDVYFITAVDEPEDKYFWSNAYYNQSLILQSLKDEINHGETKSECLLCYNTFNLTELKSACGNCTQQLCSGCAKNWYSQNSPGNIVLETYSRCPFCKQLPKFDVIKNHNRVLCQFNARKHVFDNSCYEAWCHKCGKIDEFMAKTCSNDIPKLDGTYTCQICKLKEETLDSSEYQKTCPGCSAMTYKTGGCNHMTCIVDGCNTHWCWVCKWKHVPGDMGIYEHLDKVHGGTYDFQRHEQYGDSGDEYNGDEYSDGGY